MGVLLAGENHRKSGLRLEKGPGRGSPMSAGSMQSGGQKMEVIGRDCKGCGLMLEPEGSGSRGLYITCILCKFLKDMNF